MDVPVKYSPRSAPPTPQGPLPVPDDNEIPTGELSPLQTALRHKWAIGVFALAVAGLTYAIAERIPSVYTSTAQVAYNVEQLHIFGANSAFSSPNLSADVMATEMAVLNSPVIAEAVVRQLDLQSLHDFQSCTRPPGFLTDLRARFIGPDNETCKVDIHQATNHLLGSVMTFSNDHTSYVADILAATHDPTLSASIANAYANAFINWRIGNHDQRAAQADVWLSHYLDDLRTKMVAANNAVESYRQEHHLIGIGPSVPGGTAETIIGQRLSQLNSQLGDTDAQLATAQATLSQTHGGGGALSSATALDSPVVVSMLERRAEAEANLETLRARYGDDHPKVLSAQADVNRLNAQLGTETTRSVVSLQGQVRALEGRRAAIEGQVQALQSSVAGESQSDVRLEELTRQADTENSLYRTMLERTKELDADQHTELADASLVVPAEPSFAPTSPHRSMLVAGAFLASLGLGAGLAFVRELTAGRFRDIRQIQNETGLPVLGIFPLAPRGTSPRDLVLDKPFSAEAEMLHQILSRLENDVDRADGGRILLVTSALPGEGKSSFGVALGRLASQAGLRTILIDGDLRRSSLAPMMESGARAEPGTALVRSDAVTTDKRSGLAMLSLAALVGDARRIVAARGVGELLAELRTRYDMIIIDTPPVLAVPDGASLAAFADDVVTMLDWTQASRESVGAALEELRRARAHFAGIVVSKIGLKEYASIATSPTHDIRRYRDYMPRVAA